MDDDDERHGRGWRSDEEPEPGLDTCFMLPSVSRKSL